MGMMNVLSGDLRHYVKLFMTLKYKITDNCMYFIVFRAVKMETNSSVYNNVKYICYAIIKSRRFVKIISGLKADEK
jgi:hypothetical protein